MCHRSTRAISKLVQKWQALYLVALSSVTNRYKLSLAFNLKWSFPLLTLSLTKRCTVFHKLRTVSMFSTNEMVKAIQHRKCSSPMLQKEYRLTILLPILLHVEEWIVVKLTKVTDIWFHTPIVFPTKFKQEWMSPKEAAEISTVRNSFVLLEIPLLYSPLEPAHVSITFTLTIGQSSHLFT